MQKSNVVLSTTSIQTLVSPMGKDDPPIYALYLNQYRMTMMSLFRLYELLLAEAPDLVKRTNFAQAIETLSTLPLVFQKQVIEYSSLSFWVEVAWDLVNRHSHILFPEMHISFHLQGFWRFVLAAALKEGHQDLSCTLCTNRRGLIALPATGTYLQLETQEPYTCFKIQLSGTQLQVWREDYLPVAFTICPLPRLGTGLELNAMDDDGRLPGRTQANYEELTPDTTLRWQESLAQRWDWIVRASPLLAQEIALGLKIIVPVSSPSVETHLSASYHEAPGLITMSWTTDQAVLTEAIVHEYHHQKLHALMCVDPLLLGPVHIPVYYSPWRNDPRPLRGLLHAAFTFQAILEFYNQLLLANVLEQTESVSQRIYKCSRQVAIALDSLSQHTHFSTLGYALFESLKTNLTRQQTLMPIVSEEGKQSVDALLTSHRNEWERQYGSLARNLPLSTSTPSAALSPGPAVPEQQKQLEQRVLQALQLPPEFSLTALGDPESQHDPVIDCVRLEQREQRLDAVAVLVQEIAPSGSLFLKLTGAHVAYIADGYERAEQLYKACLHHQPTNTLFWQYYAFTLRHLRQWAASRFILQNLQRLVDPHVFSDGQSATSDDVVEDRLALLRQIDPSAAEVLPEASPFPTNVSALPRQDYPFKHFFSGKKLQRFFEFAPTGGQFPTSLAVLHKLKPTMDLWIPPQGWAAFQSLVEELGLVYHVDTYFDPYSPQLDHFSPDSFTTTRAALSRTFGEHTQAHVFLSYDLEHLYPAVSSGWYPLVIDSHLVSKHMPDHNKFGEALGYPACCQHFFLERNDWHSDNTFYAAYHNTHMVPQKFSNGSLRHTLFSLVPYIPCSMGCQATIHYASTLHALMASEFPAYAQEVELHLSSPILCLSELRVYRFTGTLMEEAGILLLLRRAGILAVGATLLEVDDSNYILAQQLYKELGGLPLALDQAAAFINANLQEVPKSRINACPGVLRLVEFGGDPQSVPQHVIDTIVRQLNRLNGQPFQIAHNFSPGDVVQVKYGPLQDLELVFAGSMTPGGRVHVLLELLGRLKEVQVEYAREKCVHELFEAQVERAPDAIALTCDDQMLSYNALNCHANQLAHQLIAQGVTAETLVGIYVDRSLEMLVDLSQRTSL